MGRLGRIQSSAAVQEPPEKLVFLQPRADLDLSPGRRRLNGVANENIGEVRKASGSDQAGGTVSSISLDRRIPRDAAFLLEIRARWRSSSDGRQVRSLRAGGRPTNMRLRRMRWARPAWLIMIRRERAVSGSSVRESRSWARPTITASGLLSSCPRPAANSLTASSLRLPPAVPLRFRPIREKPPPPRAAFVRAVPGQAPNPPRHPRPSWRFR